MKMGTSSLVAVVVLPLICLLLGEVAISELRHGTINGGALLFPVIPDENNKRSIVTR